MTSTVYFVRGLPGVGKSTYAKTIPNAVRVEADAYFVRPRTAASDDPESGVIDLGDGTEYAWEASKIRAAHEWAQRALETLLRRGQDVILSNTFTTQWEADAYLKIANKYGAEIHVVDLFDGGFSDEALAARNRHGVPKETIARMRARYEPEINTDVV